MPIFVVVFNEKSTATQLQQQLIESRTPFRKEIFMNKVSFSYDEKKSENQEDRNIEPITKKIGRNDPCPCGSGKKYKQCHGN